MSLDSHAKMQNLRWILVLSPKKQGVHVHPWHPQFLRKLLPCCHIHVNFSFSGGLYLVNLPSFLKIPNIWWLSTKFSYSSHWFEDFHLNFTNLIIQFNNCICVTCCLLTAAQQHSSPTLLWNFFCRMISYIFHFDWSEIATLKQMR